MNDPALRERAVLVLGLVLGTFLLGACDAVALVDNDPVPLPVDLGEMLRADLGVRFDAADGSVPPVSPSRALEIAGVQLLAEQDSNRVPRQDPSVPDGLIRRVMTVPPDPPRSVWLVAYRWAAGFDCRAGVGPGPCPNTSFYFIDDRTGQLVTSHAHTDSPPARQ